MKQSNEKAHKEVTCELVRKIKQLTIISIILVCSSIVNCISAYEQKIAADKKVKAMKETNEILKELKVQLLK